MEVAWTAPASRSCRFPPRAGPAIFSARAPPSPPVALLGPAGGAPVRPAGRPAPGPHPEVLLSPVLDLRPEPAKERDGRLERSAVLEGATRAPFSLSFRLPLEERTSLSAAADPFVLAATFPALRLGGRLRVRGRVSPALLRGLVEFQAAWCRWRPDRYRPFEVEADEEGEETPAPGGAAVATFSGGLDSCATVRRHAGGAGDRRARPLASAVLVHGFDIPLSQPDTFDRAATRARTVLASVGVRLVPVATNLRDLGDDWEDAHGAALAACLHLLSRGHATGLIAASHAYEHLRFPWGSNPLTDPMLSSAAFAIVHDGCDGSRLDKARAVSGWDEARASLRVCWEGPQLDSNCGTCVRCLATALCFAAQGLPVPPVLAVPSAEEAVLRLRRLRPGRVQLVRLEEIARVARARDPAAAWADGALSFVRARRRVARWRVVERWLGFGDSRRPRTGRPAATEEDLS